MIDSAATPSANQSDTPTDAVSADDLRYGLDLRIYDTLYNRVVQVCVYSHPDEQRFLILLNRETRRYQVLDWSSLRVETESLLLQSMLGVQRSKYFVIQEESRWIFVFDDEPSRTRALQGFLDTRKLYKKAHASCSFEAEALKQFYRYNSNNDSCIEEEELRLALQSINIEYDEEMKTVAKKLADEQAGVGFGLSKQRFKDLVQLLLAKRELVPHFQKYCPGLSLSDLKSRADCAEELLRPSMTRAQMEQFLLKQHQTQTKDEISEVLSNLPWRDGDKISFCDFCRFVFSDHNTILDPTKRKFHQSLDEPLTHYFIYSSHNTYLVGNQLTSQSKIHRYLEDFYRGVRCVELDIHDGATEPIIKHGFTVTSAIPFQMVIQQIALYSQHKKGHLPLILSFENHCGPVNQKKMANILNKYLGDRIFILPSACDNTTQRMPTPNQLRGKIIIQGTIPFLQLRPNSKIEEIPPFQPSGRLSLFRKQLSARTTLDRKAEDYPEQFQAARTNFKVKNGDRKKYKNQMTDLLKSYCNELTEPAAAAQEQPTLSHYYSVVVGKYDRQRTCWEMANMSQGVAKGNASNWKKKEEMAEFSKKSLIRIYPLGLRFDSSNYNPIPFMEVGAQIASLNTQNDDPFSYMIASTFLENGDSQGGYVLKPDFLITDSVRGFHKREVTVRIISFHNLRSLEPEQRLQEVEVQMAMYCCEEDCKSNKNCELTVVTEKIDKVRFSGVFKQSKVMKYVIGELQFAYLHIVVEGCGQVSVPLKMARTGLRTIPLMNESKEFIHYSYLLAELKIEECASG